MAFCYQDGGQKDESTLTERQKSKAIKKMPNLIELASYTYYTQACALGVFFEYTDYIRFIKCEGEYKDSVSPILPSLKSLATALAFTGIFVGANSYYSIETCYTEEFASWSFAYKYWFYMVSMSVKRFFYYGPFMFTTGAIQASGLGYNSKTKSGAEDWDKVRGVYALNIEVATSVITMLRDWNHQVHLWLKFYVQERLSTPGKRAPTWVGYSTFVVSAFWHGFYSTYYITFFTAAILS
jgi:hypothetical protein